MTKTTVGTYISPDWRAVVAAWDAARRERHAAEAARLVALGWKPDSAAYLAYEREQSGRLSEERP